ncbi:hypothetical protein L6164_001140 [Bauhinia variegata]|uniref:Uncharacterized protein n=1 Tax=Bauhinia variegata TaxID=167791 RepID=A0ACB9QA07_BAUVA|nr:hypothetical protein L6164_001140 [Bauhinia variegata]
MAGENFPTPVHSIIMFWVEVILALLGQKFQYDKVTPYVEHGAIILGIYISLLIYCMGLIIEFGCEITNQALCLIIKRFNPILGALLVVMLTLLLHSGFGWFTFALWVISLVGTLRWSWPEIKEIKEKITEKMRVVQ